MTLSNQFLANNPTGVCHTLTFESARGLYRQKQFAEAVKEWERALPLVRFLGLHEREATALNSTGNNYVSLVQHDKAVIFYEQALVVYRELKDIRSSANTLGALGRSSTSLNQFEKALGYHKQSLVEYREVKDRSGEGSALGNLGFANFSLKLFKDSIESFEQALVIHRETKERGSEAADLSMLGAAYLSLSENERASNYFELALKLSRESKNRTLESVALTSLGDTYVKLGKYEKAIGYLEEALVLSREVKSRSLEAPTLYTLGMTYYVYGKNNKAVGYFEQLLVLAREIKDRKQESLALNGLGMAYGSFGQSEKAANYHEQSLALARETKDRNLEGLALNTLGLIYASLSRTETAIAHYEQALAIFRELKNRPGEGLALWTLGNSYTSLSQYEKAIDYFNQALTHSRELKNSGSEAQTLVSIGYTYWRMKQYEKSLEYSERSLALIRELKLGSMAESSALTTLGFVYGSMGQNEKAIQYSEQALAVFRELRLRGGEAGALFSLGSAYKNLNQYPKAMGNFEQALAITRETKSREGESEILGSLMDVCKSTGKPRLGVFYGKQAINTLQSMRGDIRGLAQESQQSFLKGNAKTYHKLIELLIAQGRLAEAEQVMALLKEKEYFDYIRRDTAEAASLKGRATLTAEEAEWEKGYNTKGDLLVTIGTERGELLAKLQAKKPLTPEETARLTQLDQDIETGNKDFETFLKELSTHFAAKSAGTQRIEDLREAQGIMEELRELPVGTVAIYTLMGEEKLSIILRTPEAQKAYAFPIKAADLNRKVLDFHQVIQNPKLDPRPLAQELYKILIGPMARDLRRAKAKTLMWSLDGALRYIPLAALHDGKQYLIEQYRMSVFTPASNTRLKDKPTAEWNAAGFGVTKAWEGSSPLPAVAGELSGIITTKSGDGGVLAGEIQLDDKFTQVSMREALRKRPSVVHIASHFQFQAGDQTNSFLLLGDGGRLSMEELRTSANLFSGVQLLTLSACNTGVGDGAEVEGFGVLAQRQGAKAVIASLWPVADTSTSFLMREFYRIRESAPTMTKVEALGRAQIELLRGTAKPTAGAERAFVHEAETKKTTKVNAPSFQVNEAAPYAHPYYWAPFFLMGNWL